MSSLRLRGLPETQTALLQTHEPLAADHQGIQYLDVHQFPRVHQGARHRDVLEAGGWIAARMVMHDNHGGGVVAHRLAEKLAHPRTRAVDRASVDGPDLQWRRYMPDRRRALL